MPSTFVRRRYPIIYNLALLIGIVSGLRAATPLAAMSWAARLGILTIADSPLAFFGYAWTPWILTVCALGELIADKLPQTPSRKSLSGFGTRILMGAVSGTVLTLGAGSAILGGILGGVGGVIGTFAGAAGRARLAPAIGRDLPAALIEDAVAITTAVLIVFARR